MLQGLRRFGINCLGLYWRAIWKPLAVVSLGLVVLLTGVYFAWKQVAVRKIIASGGWVYYGKMDDLPDWLRGAFGDDGCQRFLPVRDIHLDNCANVGEVLWWSRPLLVTADELTFWHCGLTDDSIRLIPRATRLKVLAIYGSEVSDASVEYLAGFRFLAELIIVETKISQRGAKELEAALPNCKVYWKE